LLTRTRVWVIDFGFATRLLTTYSPRCVSNIVALQDEILHVTNAVQWKRWDGRLSHYNPQVLALIVLLGRVKPHILSKVWRSPIAFPTANGNVYTKT